MLLARVGFLVGDAIDDLLRLACVELFVNTCVLMISWTVLVFRKNIAIIILTRCRCGSHLLTMVLVIEDSHGVAVLGRLYRGQVGALPGHKAALALGLVLWDSSLCVAVLAHLGVVSLVDHLMSLERWVTHCPKSTI